MLNDLIYASPESQGISSVKIADFINEISRNKFNVHSLLFYKDGKIITECYAKPFDENFKHRLYSCSKTFVSLAIGVLVDRKVLKLSDKIYKFFPEFINENTDKLLLETTIEDALKMSVPGEYCSYAMMGDDEWTSSFFRIKASKPAGMLYNYDTSASYILCALIEKITGKDFLGVLRPVLDEIGVAKDIWCVKAPDGHSWGGSGVQATLRDFAKVGELLLYKGLINGKQLISEKYMRKMTAKQISTLYTNGYYSLRKNIGYGYQTWITDSGYGMFGMGGQYVFCFPDKDFMFVCQSDTQGSDEPADYIYNMVYSVYKSIRKTPLKETQQSADKLKKAIEGFKLPRIGADHSPFEKQINGKVFKLNQNDMNIAWLKLNFEQDRLTLEYQKDEQIKTIDYGYNDYILSTFPETRYAREKVGTPCNEQMKSLFVAGWLEKKKLLLRNYIIDSDLGSMYMTLSFKNNYIAIRCEKAAEFMFNDYRGYAYGKY